jgi:hypothetical protein
MRMRLVFCFCHRNVCVDLGGRCSRLTSGVGESCQSKHGCSRTRLGKPELLSESRKLHKAIVSAEDPKALIRQGSGCDRDCRLRIVQVVRDGRGASVSRNSRCAEGRGAEELRS